MIDPADRHRIGQARLLRRQGHTYEEIRAVVGPVSDDRMQQWMKGIPRPHGTWRSAPHTAVQRECRRLRALGLTHPEIAELTGASEGSISVWVRDVGMPAHLRDLWLAKVQRGRAKGAQGRHSVAERVRLERVDEARASIGDVSDRDLFIAGVALYWAEGSKDKPWRRSGQVTLINSDPSVL
jgi:hypothetical protein